MKTPEGWRQVSMGEVAVPGGIQTGPFGSQLHSADYTPTGIPVIMPKDMKFGRVDAGTVSKVPLRVVEKLSQHMLKPGDIVFARRGDIGRCCLIGEVEDGWLCGTGSLRVRPDSSASPEFLFNCLQASEPQTWLNDNAVGQTMLNLSATIVSGIPLLLPPLPEQKKIAEILGSVDEAIRATKALIEQTRRVKQGLLQQLLTRGIGHTRFKMTEIGEIPESWEVISANDLVPGTAPICYGILMPGKGYPGGIPVVKVKNLVDDRVQEEGLLLTSPELDREYARSRLRGGDLLLSIRGTTGRLALVPQSLEGANITQDTVRIRVEKRLTPLFAFYCLQGSSSQRQIQLHTIGQAVKGINVKEVRKIKLPRPPKKEQEQICAVLQSVDEWCGTHRLELSGLTSSRSGLTQDLLTGHVRVHMRKE